MKKLLIVASLAFAASFVQAASVAWNGYGVATSGGVSTDANAWQVVLMDTSKTTISALSDAFASKDADTITTAITAGKVATTSAILVGDTSKYRWSGPEITTEGGTYYTLFVDRSIAKDQTGYYLVTAEQTVTNPDVGESAALSFGDQSTATWNVYETAAPASDVPEPTSAMLLMLGMAGLALRRRARKE